MGMKMLAAESCEKNDIITARENNNDVNNFLGIGLNIFCVFVPWWQICWILNPRSGIVKFNCIYMICQLNCETLYY